MPSRFVLVSREFYCYNVNDKFPLEAAHENRKLIFIGLFIFLSVVIGSFIYFPKSIDTALNRIKYPFEVGEILTSQQIDENLIVVIYTNKNNNNELQNAIIQKTVFL